MSAPTTSPSRVMDELLDYCGREPFRLNLAYAAELARPRAQRRQALLQVLADRLGWPLPDTPPGEVLAGLKRDGIIPAQVLAREAARPAHLQRPALLAALQERVAGLGAWANSPTVRAPGGLG
jgi:hypothetical protein